MYVCVCVHVLFPALSFESVEAALWQRINANELCSVLCCPSAYLLFIYALHAAGGGELISVAAQRSFSCAQVTFLIAPLRLH